MTVQEKIEQFNNASDQFKINAGTLHNAVNTHGTVTINSIERDTLPKILSDADAVKNDVIAKQSQVDTVINDVNQAFKTSMNTSFYRHTFTTAQAVYDAINNAPEGARLEIRYKGTETLLASKVNVGSKRVYMSMQNTDSDSEFIFDTTLVLIGGHFSLCKMVNGGHNLYITVRTGVMFEGLGTVYLGGYYRVMVRTDLTSLTLYRAKWHSNSQSIIGSVELFGVRLTFTREDGTAFDETNPLSITYTETGEYYGMGFNRHKISEITLNEATTTQDTIVGQ